NRHHRPRRLQAGRSQAVVFVLLFGFDVPLLSGADLREKVGAAQPVTEVVLEEQPERPGGLRGSVLERASIGGTSRAIRADRFVGGRQAAPAQLPDRRPGGMGQDDPLWEFCTICTNQPTSVGV